MKTTVRNVIKKLDKTKPFVWRGDTSGWHHVSILTLLIAALFILARLPSIALILLLIASSIYVLATIRAWKKKWGEKA